MNFVLDNSIAMRWYFGDGKPADLAYAARVLEILKSAEARVPDIWSLEVANVLARAEAKGLVTEARSEVFIGLLSRLNIVIDGETSNRAWGSTLQLARRYQLSAYDAAYLELALRDGLPLATLDANVMKAARRAGVKRFDITLS
ncbi:MAG TPA: type II toxin-antitoxin system VapC family toxin [Gammaproteobacteria bacterium]|nr:type II toxin-antitoxin system VapC family toxin [Gammaproteobacteria bacterium]